MPVTVDLTEDMVTTAVRAFILAVVPDPPVEVVQGQANKVPSPMPPDYLVFWPIWRGRLATNEDSGASTDPAPTTRTMKQSTQADIQLDLHGPRGADLAQIIATLWRDPFACEFFDAWVDPGTNAPISLQPLFCDDGHQMPFIDENKQYEDRWTLSLSMQINPVVSTTQQYADTVAIGLIEVDATYPPEPVAP